ncbi:hypothetical protein KCU89_g11665, partial [Aureobasidium melanogenum]
AAAFAMAIQWRNWKLIWLVPIVFGFIGAVEAIIAGNVVGGLLSGVYSAGYFRMSTWIPFSWGAINSLVLILSSFAIQGGIFLGNAEQEQYLAMQQIALTWASARNICRT